jgi:hypothetical protein
MTEHKKTHGLRDFVATLNTPPYISPSKHKITWPINISLPPPSNNTNLPQANAIQYNYLQIIYNKITLRILFLPVPYITVSGVASLQILLHNNSTLHIITTPNKIQSHELLLNEMFTSNNIYIYSIYSFTNIISNMNWAPAKPEPAYNNTLCSLLFLLCDVFQ